MEHDEIHLISKDNLTLFSQMWIPPIPRCGVVCLVHGLGEHSGRYAHVAQALNAAGFVLAGLDLRGHGKSEGPRGYWPSLDSVFDDVDLFIRTITERFPELPVFLYGHSLGGELVLLYGLKRKPHLTGVIATSPSLGLSIQPPAWKIALSKALYQVAPSFSLPSGLDAVALSHDPQVVAAYRRDPLVHDRISIRTGQDMLTGGAWALAHAGELPIPLLLMHGSQDQITSPDASREFAQKANGKATFKLWEGLYHEIHNEPEKQAVISFMIEWLDRIVSGLDGRTALTGALDPNPGKDYNTNAK